MKFKPSVSLRQGIGLALGSPAGVFVLGCFAAPSLLQLVSPLDSPLGIPFFTAWPVLLWLSIGLTVVVVTFSGILGPVRDPSTVSRAEAWTASWYLINGFFFNSMMDVFAGQFQSWTTMTARYNELEPRYAAPGYGGVVVLLTSMQELLIQTPIGLTLFYLIWTGSPYRLGLEIVFNCWSVAGVWYFYLSEPVLGFPYVHTPFSKSGQLQMDKAFTMETLWKFWIGFVIFPALWAIMGIILAVRAGSDIAALSKKGEKKEKSG